MFLVFGIKRMIYQSQPGWFIHSEKRFLHPLGFSAYSSYSILCIARLFLFFDVFEPIVHTLQYSLCSFQIVHLIADCILQTNLEYETFIFKNLLFFPVHRCGRIYPCQSTVVAGYILSSPPLWQDISFPVHRCGRKYPFQSIVVAAKFLFSPNHCRKGSFRGPPLLQERFFPLHHSKKDLFQPTIMHGSVDPFK